MENNSTEDLLNSIDTTISETQERIEAGNHVLLKSLEQQKVLRAKKKEYERIKELILLNREPNVQECDNKI